MGRVHLGTSGYAYRHWRRLFYPDKLPARLWLDHYARVFSTVELNTLFYRLPTEEAVDRWREETPPSFLFACKGSRYLTHLKRLTESEVGLLRYFEKVERLGVKLGPVLWQLPPQMSKVELPRLEAFLQRLPPHVHHAFEFRAATWYTDEVCALLEQYGAAFCEHDLVPRRPPRHPGGFRYLRFHGSTGKYRGRYGRAALEPVAEDLVDWTSGGKHAFVYFNNDLGGHALLDALELAELLPSPARSPPRAARARSVAPS